MERTVNKVELTGYLGADPVMFNPANGNSLARLRVATTESYKNKNGEWVNNTMWHNIVLWGKLAKEAVSELKKGNRISLIGRIVYNKYTDKEGADRYVTDIVVSSYKMVETVVPITL